MNVGQLMTRRVVTVGPDDRLETIRALFARHGFHHLLVVDGGKVVGVISDRDLLRALSPALGTMSETARDAATLNKRAHQIMSRQIRSLTQDASLHDAMAAFTREMGISCLPVLDANQKPLGILSWRDILRALQPEEARVSRGGSR